MLVAIVSCLIRYAASPVATMGLFMVMMIVYKTKISSCKLDFPRKEIADSYYDYRRLNTRVPTMIQKTFPTHRHRLPMDSRTECTFVKSIRKG